MSSLTDQMYANAATSRRGMITGTFEDPIRRSWGEVHDEARRMAGALSDAGVVPGTSVAVLAGDPADVAPLAQAVWMRGASLTMLAQPTPRTELATWLADTHRAARTIGAALTIVGEPFADAAEPLERPESTWSCSRSFGPGPPSNRCIPTSQRSRCTS